MKHCRTTVYELPNTPLSARPTVEQRWPGQTADKVPPLQGGGQLPGDFLLGLRSALHPRLLQDGLSALRLQTEAAAELDALLPAILDRTFKGEL
jgi:hypothetical protein